MIIAFSILDVNKNELKDKIKEFTKINPNNYIHFDVMDGVFVKHKNDDFKYIEEVAKLTKLFKDIHFMTKDPIKHIDKCKKMGMDQITIHYEAMSKGDLINTIKKIKDNNIKVGLSIKPNTPVSLIKKYLFLLDSVLIMSVEPGKGGQEFIESSLDKIKELSNLQKDNHYLIAVDGGINDKNIKKVKDAGADVAVIGSYFLKNGFDKKMFNL